MFNPWATSSTYCLVAASFGFVGEARLIIVLLVISKLPAILLTPVPVTLRTPVVVKLPALTFPVTDNEDNVPTLVIFGCALVVTVAAVVAAPLNAPTNVVLVTLDKPAIVVTVSPKVSVVLPKVTDEFANLD